MCLNNMVNPQRRERQGSWWQRGNLPMFKAETCSERSWWKLGARKWAGGGWGWLSLQAEKAGPGGNMLVWGNLPI